MVTEQEIKNREFKTEFEKERFSYKVTGAEMQRFSENRRKLAYVLNKIILKFENEKGCSRNKIAENIENNCRQSWDTYKKIISGKIKATRVALYKFCIGMNLSREEADTLFELTDEGKLTDDNIGDYIFIKALGHDDIDFFIQQFEHYTGKHIDIRERIK